MEGMPIAKVAYVEYEGSPTLPMPVIEIAQRFFCASYGMQGKPIPDKGNVYMFELTWAMGPNALSKKGDVEKFAEECRGLDNVVGVTVCPDETF